MGVVALLSSLLCVGAPHGEIVSSVGTVNLKIEYEKCGNEMINQGVVDIFSVPYFHLPYLFWGHERRAARALRAIDISAGERLGKADLWKRRISYGSWIAVLPAAVLIMLAYPGGHGGPGAGIGAAFLPVVCPAAWDVTGGAYLVHSSGRRLATVGREERVRTAGKWLMTDGVLRWVALGLGGAALATHLGGSRDDLALGLAYSGEGLYWLGPAFTRFLAGRQLKMAAEPL